MIREFSLLMLFHQDILYICDHHHHHHYESKNTQQEKSLNDFNDDDEPSVWIVFFHLLFCRFFSTSGSLWSILFIYL